MGILTWLVLGVVVGWWAKILLPGKSPGGRWPAVGASAAGAIAGGIVATVAGFGHPLQFDVPSLFLALGGASSALFVHRLIVDRYDKPPHRSFDVALEPAPSAAR